MRAARTEREKKNNRLNHLKTARYHLEYAINNSDGILVIIKMVSAKEFLIFVAVAAFTADGNMKITN